MWEKSRMIEVEWARMTAPELREIAMKENALAVLPIGSLEQHGPHLPVITDTASALAASVRAAQLVAEETPVAVLPGLWLGLSEHHLPFGGTISIDYKTLNNILGCIVRSLKALGFDRLLIVNGHGGNVEPLAVAVRELQSSTACRLSRACLGASRQRRWKKSLKWIRVVSMPVKERRPSCWRLRLKQFVQISLNWHVPTRPTH